MTQKGKGKPKEGQVGEGSKDILTRSKFDLEFQEDILKTDLSQPNGVDWPWQEGWLKMVIGQMGYGTSNKG